MWSPPEGEKIWTETQYNFSEERVNKSKTSKTKKGNSREESTTSALLLLLFFSWKNLKSKNAQVRILGSVRYMWLKTKNYYLKIFVKIRIEIKIYKILFKNWKLLFETIIKHPNWVTSFKLFSLCMWFFTLLVIYIKRIDGAISLAIEMSVFKEPPYRRPDDNNDLEGGRRESERVCFLSLYFYFYFCFCFYFFPNLFLLLLRIWNWMCTFLN